MNDFRLLTCKDSHFSQQEYCEICYLNSNSHTFVTHNTTNKSLNQLLSQRMSYSLKRESQKILKDYNILPCVLIEMVMEFICSDVELWYVCLSAINPWQKHLEKQCLWFIPSESPLTRIFHVHLPPINQTLIMEKLNAYNHIFYLCQWIATQEENRNFLYIWEMNLSNIPRKWILLATIQKPIHCHLDKLTFDFRLNDRGNILSIRDYYNKRWIVKHEIKSYFNHNITKEKKLDTSENTEVSELDETLETFISPPMNPNCNTRQKNEKYHLDLEYNVKSEASFVLHCTSETCFENTDCCSLYHSMVRCKNIASRTWISIFQYP